MDDWGLLRRCAPRNNMSKSLFHILLLSLILLSVFSCQTTGTDTVLVTRVIDGDTIVLAGGEHLRYIGMDTPEIGQLYYEEAKKANEELVLGKKVRLEKDVSEVDRYKRLLRYVYVDDTFVNAELVKRGMARSKAYRPDIKHQSELEALQKEAILEGIGLWALKPSLPGKR